MKMHKALKIILLVKVSLFISILLVNLLKQNIYSLTKEKINYENLASTFFKDVTLESAGVFLYTKDYSARYLFSANTTIINPTSNIEEDSFFPTLLDYNRVGVCTVVNTTHLPTDSSLYLALDSKNRIQEDIYYMACPIFTKKGLLVGYLSETFTNDGQISPYLQKLKYYTRIVERNLQNIL